MAVEVVEFFYVAPIIVGLIIGLVELFFVHADESGLGWLSHGLHAIPTCVFLTFISMNIPAVMQFASKEFGMAWLTHIAVIWTVPILVGIISAGKVKAAAAIVKGGSAGESWMHALIIGGLIAVSPYVWMFIVSAKLLPWSWMLLSFKL
jgi:hypothetical protein